MRLASEKGLFARKITRVKGNANADLKRSLIAFDKKSEVCISDLLIIEKERNVYTEAYTELTKDFYLKM